MKCPAIFSISAILIFCIPLQASPFLLSSACSDCDSLSITLISQEDITCFQSFGYIEVEGAGGVLPYSYEWSIPGSNLNYIEVTETGLYSVTVTDANECTVTATYAIFQIDGPEIVLIHVTPESCPGACDAVVEIDVFGGTPPFQYITDLPICTGTYQLTVVDALGCTDTEDFFVWSLEGPVIQNISIINADPGTENGAIEIDAEGNGALQYSIDGISYQASNVFTGLPAGTYTVYVMDENGCIENYNVIISQLSSTATVEFENLKIYPNPADDILLIESAIPLAIRISDTNGHMLISKAASLLHQISTLHLAPGIFFVTLTDGVNTGYQKLVIN